MDINSLLPFLMMNNNGDNKNMANVLNMMNAMNSSNGEKTEKAAPKDSDDSYIQNNCKEPKFWNSPARECGSEQEPGANATSGCASGGGNNDSANSVSGGGGAPSGIDNLAPLLAMMNKGEGGGNNLAPLLAMMNNGNKNSNAGGGNPLMSMLPFLMNNNNNGKKASTNSQPQNPLYPVRHFCPLPIRLKLSYYLVGEKG